MTLRSQRGTPYQGSGASRNIKHRVKIEGLYKHVKDSWNYVLPIVLNNKGSGWEIHIVTSISSFQSTTVHNIVPIFHMSNVETYSIE